MIIFESVLAAHPGSLLQVFSRASSFVAVMNTTGSPVREHSESV